MRGHVRSYDQARRFGFIRGQDGHDYFFHIDDIHGPQTPALNQAVTFEPRAAPKGPRAGNVVLGAVPQRVLVNPDRFIMTREDSVRGYQTVAVRATGIWAESNDPNRAKDDLADLAKQWGANAVVNLQLEKYSKQDGPCSNYYYTMHRFYGDAVVVQRPSFTNDPNNFRGPQSWQSPGQHPPMHSTALVRPPMWIFLPVLLWGMTRTFVVIFGLVCLCLAMHAVPFLRRLPLSCLKRVPVLPTAIAGTRLSSESTAC
jgi:cold shock CspA family protein/uncharacterized protein YbjQ (UPF0145 family)